MPHRIITGIVMALACACAGCGGSGGGAGSEPGTTGGATTLGARGVPGGSVTVSCSGTIRPGTVNVFRLALGDGLSPISVTAWITAEVQPGDPGIQATPVPSGAGTYEVSLPVPARIPSGSHVRVSMAFADGSVIDTGAEDFPIGGD